MLPASVLPEKTEVCRLYFYLTLPNRWCAQMRRTERRGYRMAKAVELLVVFRLYLRCSRLACARLNEGRSSGPFGWRASFSSFFLRRRLPLQVT